MSTDNRPVTRQIRVVGQVQGVGFRPFVYRLAHQLGLKGSVCNQHGQVEIILQGATPQLDKFNIALVEDAPAIADPHIESWQSIPAAAHSSFKILPSQTGGQASVHVPPDHFSCPECLAELHDPNERRYAYPFINCTQCGPRYTLIESLPYDRPNTSMSGFVLCEACQREYSDPLDRRFHAEPIACPECGPQLSYVSSETGQPPGVPLTQAVNDLQAGRVVAVKGIGGYHLMCDAYNEAAVIRLRKRKHRPDKPLAVMFAVDDGRNNAALKRSVRLTDIEWEALIQPARPIVLLSKRADCALAESIAPGLNEVGVMLAYSPLHDLLLHTFSGPLVATSGNLSGEPVITSRAMAEKRLSHIADGFLHHDRPIVRPADDSVLRVIADNSRLIRPGRGLAPLEIELPRALNEPVLALGGHMKVTVALAWGRRLVVSPHIGEMGSPRSLQVFEQLIDDLQVLYGVTAKRLICDAHPGYTSHKWAISQGLPVSTIWHHHAHASAVMLEVPACDEHDSVSAPVLVFAWDGVGWGPDASLWGGETLLGQPGAWQRYAHCRAFNVPGGDLAGRAPWRSAAAVCWAMDQDAPEFDAIPADSVHLVKSAWKKNINAPKTTAVGRLFDAASALLGIAEQASFEGQGPMQLEALACTCKGEAIELPILKSQQDESLQVDWAPLIQHMLNNLLSPEQRAADWHESLATVMLRLAERARADYSLTRVGLSGGVFQNRLLTERALDLLNKQGFSCYFPQRLPVNDGGLCAGQVNEFLHYSGLSNAG